MNILLKTLAQICRTHKIQEKLLLCNTLSTGHQLLESLSKENVPWLNLRPVTPLELATEQAKPMLLTKNITIPTEGQLLFLLEEILQQMRANSQLQYFAELHNQNSLTRVLYPTIKELRLTGITASQLNESSFVDPCKGQEIITVLTLWEEKLSSLNWADAATIYNIALQTKTNSSPYYLIPEDLDLSPLELTFVKHLTSHKQIILPQDPVLNHSHSHTFTTPQPTPQSPLSWLFDPQNSPQPPELTILRAYGQTNEIRQVLRHLQQENIPLDNAVVCHTSTKYIPLILTITASQNIPVTFAEGIPLGFTRPGRFTLQLIRWIEERYTSLILHQLMTSGDMRLTSATTQARLLRQANIGWERSRYIPCTESLHQSILQKATAATNEGNDPYAQYLHQQAEHVSTLKQTLTQIFSRIPDATDGNVSFPKLCRGISQTTSTYARISSPTDGLALAAIQDTLTEAAHAFSGTLPLREALRRLHQVLDTLHTAASPPKPGHLHITGLNQAAFTHRPVTFMVGLDANFPGSGLQDPVLLDQEREQIHPELSLLTHEPAKRQYRLARYLSSRRGQIILSYPSYDTVEGRHTSPAAILLQAHRLQTNNPTADYSALQESLTTPAGFLAPSPDQFTTLEEWWLTTTLKNLSAHNINTVTACYPHIASGLEAHQHRAGTDFTPYDGRVDPDLDRDPRISQTLTLSATQFENLANCPFGYFLRYVLRIQPPEDAEYDPGTWLDPLTRGSLLHDIYCTYLRQTHNPDNPQPPNKQTLLSIAEDLINQTKQTLPPPSDMVFEHEKEELLRGLEVFWRVEESAQTKPAFFEVPFGFGQQEAEEAGLGLSEPVTVTLSDGKEIRIRGRIDRIDYGTAENLYQVWDFKTGSTYGYEEQAVFKQGRQIQHALYAFAAEAILKQSGTDHNAKVEASGYLFPTDKGEGQRFARLQANRHQILELLSQGLDIVATGTFCATDDQNRCTFCDFKIVCRHPQASIQAKEKKEHPDLDAWRGLEDYE
ncbi:PD-(D/E)XK nuclease family protein [Dethiobacter alkaliphilus]|uniref:ATP-dependent nuclease subunit B-like protein n=1 Tax=Dethiobacter alkaliphilus AHT 1 TaxID=555088 RepID=C0GCZ6_DETAL|nr:PD-(D/E)XK nuclease family protein [Dethiobacter alkaliphilus]EEG79081.1 ATP-dependent nuclease subunit B-like protein [Dethiobacter alkaliphilus AHT 1]